LTNIEVRNDVAMTGEINLKGQITAIGGLEEKLFGAMKAGARVVMCPQENEIDLTNIMKKYSKTNMFEIIYDKAYPKINKSNNKLHIIMVDSIIQMLNIALVDNDINFNNLY
jgi:predicted ATP-dependent protease